MLIVTSVGHFQIPLFRVSKKLLLMVTSEVPGTSTPE
jgi:hypothetical protein